MGDDVEKKETGEGCTACEGEEIFAEGGSEETGRKRNKLAM